MTSKLYIYIFAIKFYYINSFIPKDYNPEENVANEKKNDDKLGRLA